MESEASNSPTSSFQALNEHDPNLSMLAKKMFKNVQSYLEKELQTNTSDFQLLTSMNQVTTTKYSDMKQQCDQIVVTNSELNKKYEELNPLLEQLDEIETIVQKIEEAAFRLDAYTIQLQSAIDKKF